MPSEPLQSFYAAYAGLSAAKRRLFETLLATERIDPGELCILPQPRRADDYPASSAQTRVLFFEALRPGTAVYNIPSIVRLRGTLDLAYLQRALQLAVDRHEVFRLSFELRRGHFRQIVHPRADIRLEERSLEAISPEQQAQALQETVFAYAQQPFDLTRAPLLRAVVIHGAAEQYVLFVMHHAISDGLSIRILVREVGRNYYCLLHGKPADLPALPVQYVDYALWEHARKQGDAHRAGLDFWRSQLGEEFPRLQLPADLPRSQTGLYRGDIQRFVLDEPLVEQLKALARQEGVTLFVVLLAAYQVLLGAIGHAQRIPVAVPLSGRYRAELEELIGFFGNTVICCGRLEPAMTVSKLIEHVERVVLDAHTHQEVPFEDVVAAYGRARSAHSAATYDVMFEYLDFRTRQYDVLGLDGLSWEVPQSLDFDVEVHTQTAKCDLFLCCWEGATGMSCIFEYRTDVFERNTIERWSQAYTAVLRNMTNCLDRPILELASALG